MRRTSRPGAPAGVTFTEADSKSRLTVNGPIGPGHPPNRPIAGHAAKVRLISMVSSVYVETSDGTLRKALTERLCCTPGVDLSQDGPQLHAGLGDIVIATALECSPERVASMVAAGLHVIVLSAIPREREKVSYEKAGAEAYLPMAIDTTQLVEAVRRTVALH
jgi:hypothetical protein